MAKRTIPVIDVAYDPNAAEKIVRACKEWGCFRMVGHGVSEELMSEMKGVARSLSDRPMEFKMKNCHADTPKGYTPPSAELGGSLFEGLSVYDVLSDGVLEDFCSKLEATPREREVLREYAFSIRDLAQLVGRKMTEGLGMDGEIFDNWPCQMKMNKYSYAPDTVGLLGTKLHTDPGFLTILQDDEIVTGLEAVDEITGEFVSIDPIPGSFLVNVGDVAKVWSNERFCTMKHQVMCYQPNIRTSIAFFVLAPRDGKVEAPPQLVDSDHPRRYVPFDFEGYRKLRASMNGFPMGEGLKYYLAT